MYHEAYRSREQILFQLLNSIRKSEPTGLTKIKIVYFVHLSSYQMKEYIPYLLDNDMITVDWSNSTRVAPSKTDPRKKRATVRGVYYHISEKGIEYMTRFTAMQQVVETIQI